MKVFSVRIAALTAVVTLAAFMPVSAHAALLRSSNGMPVLTKQGNCVTTNWQGGEDCEAAKAVAGMGDAACPKYEGGGGEKTVYFDFNKSSLTARTRHHLDHLAKKLQGTGKHRRGETITVVGFADRLGNAAYDQKLALKRAEAVRAYLVSKGVKAGKIEVRSLGKAQSRAECPADLPRAQLIQCLGEDRRVEIEIGAPR